MRLLRVYDTKKHPNPVSGWDKDWFIESCYNRYYANVLFSIIDVGQSYVIKSLLGVYHISDIGITASDRINTGIGGLSWGD